MPKRKWNEPPPNDLSYVFAQDPYALHALFPDRYPDPDGPFIFDPPEREPANLASPSPPAVP